MEGLNAMPSVPEPSVRTSQVGADLRLARQHLGWDLPMLAAMLRIRLTYLEAIEAGRLDDLPGNAYAVGFLRAYAAAVGLDADEIARRFRAEVADVNTPTQLAFPAPVPERGVPALAVVLVGLVVVIGAYAAWYRLSGTRDIQQQQPVAVLPEHLAPLAPPPAAPGASPVSTPTPTPAISIPVPIPVPVSTVPGVTPVPAPASAGTTASATPAPGDTSHALASLNPDGGRLSLRGGADAWIQLRDKATGAVVLEHTLKAGEVLPVPNRTGLLLTTGNAGGTILLLDGQPTPSLGAEGVVRRNLPLEIDQVRDGKLAATSVAPANSAAPVAQPRPATTN